MTLPSAQVYPENLEKVCSKCEVSQLLINFGRYSRGKYGRQAYCNKCRREWRPTKSKSIPTPKACKCPTCLLRGEIQSIDNFWRQAKSSDGLQRYCKTCQYKCNEEWNIKNPDKVRKMSKETQRRMTEANPNRFKGDYQRRKDANPEAVQRKIDRLGFYKFGVDKDWFDRQLELQGGRCAICGTDKEHYKWKRFSIDHNHECCGDNKACDKCRRGLLCHKCNLRLGFMEDKEWLIKAIMYLNSFPLGSNWKPWRC